MATLKFIYLFIYLTGSWRPLTGLCDHTHWTHIILGRNSLDEWSSRRRDLYLTTHNTHNRQTSMLPAAFDATFPASEWPQNHALDRAASGICAYSF